jgi:prepilin-type N-terminal cleavage/methylation domain-containing protein
MKQQRGFTLIEVIVTITILAAAIVPLFQIFGTYMDAMRRTADKNAKNHATQQILDYMRTVNPGNKEQEKGSVDFADYSIEWESIAIKDGVPNSSGRSGNGMFLVGYYDTATNVKNSKGDQWFDLNLKLVGYEKLEGDSGADETSVDEMEMEQELRSQLPSGPPKGRGQNNATDEPQY